MEKERDCWRKSVRGLPATAERVRSERIASLSSQSRGSDNMNPVFED
jgi:hypothetical protein